MIGNPVVVWSCRIIAFAFASSGLCFADCGITSKTTFSSQKTSLYD